MIFYPSNDTDDFTVETELFSFIRTIKIKLFSADCGTSFSSETKRNLLKSKSNFNPIALHADVHTYCGLINVGETTRQVKIQISEHKSAIRWADMASPVAKHFLQANHTVAMLIFMIEKVHCPARGGD